MINTKEDFKGKYIKLPKDINKETFEKIKAKFSKFKPSTQKYLNFEDAKEFKYIGWETFNNANYPFMLSFPAPEKYDIISIEDFLKENN